MVILYWTSSGSSTYNHYQIEDQYIYPSPRQETQIIAHNMPEIEICGLWKSLTDIGDATKWPKISEDCFGQKICNIFRGVLSPFLSMTLL